MKDKDRTHKTTLDLPPVATSRLTSRPNECAGIECHPCRFESDIQHGTALTIPPPLTVSEAVVERSNTTLLILSPAPNGRSSVVTIFLLEVCDSRSTFV